MFKPLQFSLILISTIILQSAFIASTHAQHERQQYEKSIGEIGEQINRISRNLNANKSLVASERDKLLKAEKDLYKLSQALQKTEYELAKNQHELNGLALQISKVSESQTENREALKGLLKTRFVQGKPDFLKKLLNQENPYAVGRLTNYHNYFSNALKKRFTLLGQRANELETLKQTQSETVRTLTKQRENQKKLELNYNKIKNDRAKTIAALDSKIASNAETLKKLESDRERLRSLLAQLKKQAAELKRIDELREKQEAQRRKNLEQDAKKPVIRTLVKGGFLKQKGRLKYPVSGKQTRKFGSRLPESGMRSEGSFFDTKGSVSVKSIFRGRVLFADFLKGYGLLIIIDHGDDHISLYGHNDRLLKKVGDKVDNNEVIAKTGVTGGLKSHGLYFEIRNNATPVDTSKWCR